MAEPTEDEALEFLIARGVAQRIGSPRELANGEPFDVVLNDCFKVKFSRDRWLVVPTHVVVPYAQSAKRTSEPWGPCASIYGAAVWEMTLPEATPIAYYRLGERLFDGVPRQRVLNVRPGFVLRP